MSWLPKRDKLDPVQASAIDFVVAQEGDFSIKGEAALRRGRRQGDSSESCNADEVQVPHFQRAARLW